MADVYFWRQIFILSGTLFHSVCVGIMLAFPSVLSPAITSPSSTDIKTSEDHASWIAAINGIGGLFGSILLGLIMQFLGRKACVNTTNLFYLIGWIIFVLAKSVAALYTARFIQGISIGGSYVVSIVIGEYVHPNRRGYFITLNKVAIALGILSCHGMSAFLTWRQEAIVAAIPTMLAFIFTLFWPESPSHLALKGKFEECEASFKWLYGTSEENLKNLETLVETQKEKLERNKHVSYKVGDFMKAFLKNDFKKAFLISTVLNMAIDLSGRYFIMAYVIQILMELLDDHNSAIYFTLGGDLLIVVALILSTIVIRYAKRRSILLSSGILAVILMLLISALTYLKIIYSFSTHTLWLTALVIIFQCFITNIGLIPVSFAIIGEIFPIEHKGLGTFVSGFMFTAMYAVTLKLAPVLMEHTGIYGTYAVFGICLGFCVAVLCNTLPETKDRTLKEIEDELNGVEDKEVICLEVRA